MLLRLIFLLSCLSCYASIKNVPVTWSSGYPCGIDTSLKISNVSVLEIKGAFRHQIKLSFTIETTRNITSGSIDYPIVW